MDYEWDPDKDKEIQEKHGISFDEIINLIGRGFLWKILVNPSPKYKGQKIYLVRKINSIYMVPFENHSGKCHLITAFYSKTFTEKYRRMNDNE